MQADHTKPSYPQLGFLTAREEGEASNKAWEEIAAKLGTDHIADIAVFDNPDPETLEKVSDTEYTVTAFYYFEYEADGSPKRGPVRIVLSDNIWGAI